MQTQYQFTVSPALIHVNELSSSAKNNTFSLIFSLHLLFRFGAKRKITFSYISTSFILLVSVYISDHSSVHSPGACKTKGVLRDQTQSN